MFKVGDIVEITDESDATGMLDFTKGWSYIVHETRLSEYGEYSQVFMLDDSGVTGWYHQNHFKLKEDAKVEKKECLFKEGQEVHCVLGGAGVVSHIYPQSAYPVKVYFANDTVRDYTKDGRLYEGDINRALFFSEPKIEAATEPVFEPTLKKGDVVMVFSKDTHTGMTVGIVEQETEDSVEFGIGNGSYRKSGFVFYRTGEKIEFN